MSNETPTPTGGQVELKRFYFDVPVESADGYQCFFADASTPEEALGKIKRGEGDISAEYSEVEVTSLNFKAASLSFDGAIPAPEPDLLAENAALREEVAKRAENVSTEEANELMDVLRTIVPTGRAFITSARELVATIEKVKAERDSLRATNAGLVEVLEEVRKFHSYYLRSIREFQDFAASRHAAAANELWASAPMQKPLSLAVLTNHIDAALKGAK